MLFLLLFQKTPVHIIKYFIIIQSKKKCIVRDVYTYGSRKEGKYTLHKHYTLMEIHILSGGMLKVLI